MKFFARKLYSKSLSIAIFCGTIIVAYALVRMFYSKSLDSDFSKKKFFQFDLTAGVMSGEVGPGDSVSVTPIIENTATERMYVFIEIKSPEFNSAPLYQYTVDSSWTLVESSGGNEVYAYAVGDMMTTLYPGESTSPLTPSITMKPITNAEYAEIDDINISITGYAIDIEGSANPTVVWNECKALR